MKNGFLITCWKRKVRIFLTESTLLKQRKRLETSFMMTRISTRRLLISFVKHQPDTTNWQKGLFEALQDLKESSLKFEPTNPNYSQQYRLERAIGIQSTLQRDRDIDWIKENGRCLDNVYPKQSSLPQAGQGGFASRPLKKGTVIIPVPTLVLVMNRKHLNMYKQGESDPYSKQLLTNYCFGHTNSSMLLCPASHGNLINHCSTRMKTQVGQCNPAKGPNAILRWATEFDPETSEWLSQSMKTISERIKNHRRGLTLEVVATRNIAANEEIFIGERYWYCRIETMDRHLYHNVYHALTTLFSSTC